MLSFILTADTLSGIFYQFKRPLLANSSKFFYTHGMTEGMHRNTGFYPTTGFLIIALAVSYLSVFCQPGLDSIRRQAHGMFVYIDKHGMRPDIADGITRSNKGESLCQHLVLSLHTSKHHGHVQCIRTADTHNGTLCAGINSHVILEAVHKFADTTHKCGVNAHIEVFLFITNKLRHTQRHIVLPIKFFDKVYYILIHILKLITFSDQDSFLSLHARRLE